jgi:hypothetical protein
MQSTSSVFDHQKWQQWHYWYYYNHYYRNYDYYRYQYEPWMQKYKMQTQFNQSPNFNTALETLNYLSETERWNSNLTNFAKTAKYVKEQNASLLYKNPKNSYKSQREYKKKENFVLHSDPKLLETTPGDVLNDISTLIGIDSDINYQNEVQKFEETNRLSVDEITNNEKLIELPFLAELKFNYFNTYDENGPFIPETTDENRAFKLKKSKSEKLNDSKNSTKFNNSGKIKIKMNLKNGDRIQSNITDISAIHYSNESKEDVLKQEQNVTNRRFSERLRNRRQLE